MKNIKESIGRIDKQRIGRRTKFDWQLDSMIRTEPYRETCTEKKISQDSSCNILHRFSYLPHQYSFSDKKLDYYRANDIMACVF